MTGEERPALAALLVVVPARDEEQEIAGCLEELACAAARTPLPVVVSLVLHRCSDATEQVAASVAEAHPGVTWVRPASDAPTLGEARAEGVTAGRAALAQIDPAQVWVCSTDADSRVPADWLSVQAELADAGVDLVLGTVEPVDDGTETYALWHAQHHLRDGHTAIHAANLGVRLSAYDEVGGFRALEHSEDADLVHRVRELAGLPWVSTDRTRVSTSSRRVGRVDGGFARFLRRLDDLVDVHGVTPELQARMREEILRLTAERGPERSICPSEAAAAVDPSRRQALTHLARAVACQLADEGLVQVTQHGEPCDGRTAHGPVRVTRWQGSGRQRASV